MRRLLALLIATRARAQQPLVSELAGFVDAAAPAPRAPPLSRASRVVFIKTYKTGSTTVSEFLAACGYELGLHAPPPRGEPKAFEMHRAQRAFEMVLCAARSRRVAERAVEISATFGSGPIELRRSGPDRPSGCDLDRPTTRDEFPSSGRGDAERAPRRHRGLDRPTTRDAVPSSGRGDASSRAGAAPRERGPLQGRRARATRATRPRARTGRRCA